MLEVNNEILIQKAYNKLNYADERIYLLHKDMIEKLEDVVKDALVSIKDPDFADNREQALDRMQSKVETLVMVFNQKKIHKLAFFLIIRAQANVLIELKEFDRAIKALKSLKNYCKRWQRHSDTHLLLKNIKFKEMRGTNDFNQLLMSLYHQIGLIYR